MAPAIPVEKPRTKLPRNVVEIPLTKERIVFPDAAASANGSNLAFEFFLGPGGGVPTVHKHGWQSEIFRCVRGELTVILGDERRVLRPGDTLEVPPGTFHELANEGAVEVECRVEYHPGLKSEKWLKVTGALIRREGRPPRMLELAPFINDVGMYIAGPPVWAQRALFAFLKPLAILLGYRRRALAIAEETYGEAFVW